MQSRQIQDEFALLTLTAVELGDQRKLLQTLDLALIEIQHTYTDTFTYLAKSRNILLPFTDITVR